MSAGEFRPRISNIYLYIKNSAGLVERECATERAMICREFDFPGPDGGEMNPFRTCGSEVAIFQMSRHG